MELITNLNVILYLSKCHTVYISELILIKILGWISRRWDVERGMYRVLMGKPEGKRPLGRTRGSWVDNIRMDLQEVGCGEGHV